MTVRTAEIVPIHGNVNRTAYIEEIRGMAAYAGRVDLITVPEVTFGPGWGVTDAETGDTFQHLAFGMRAEVSALTMRRINAVIEESDDPSAKTASDAKAKFRHTGDNYQFSVALDKSQGQLQKDLLSVLVEHDILSGFPDHAISWIERVGGEAVGTENQGYNLGFYEKIWELSQHADIGPADRAHLAERMIDDAIGRADRGQKRIISTGSWQTETGQQALETWRARYEAAEAEVVEILLERTDAFCKDPLNPDFNLHLLSNDIEERMLKQWRWYVNKYDQDEGVRHVRPLLEANLRLRFTEAQTDLQQAELTELTIDAAPEQPENARANRAWCSIRELEDLVTQGSNGSSMNATELLTQGLVPAESLDGYRQTLQAMQDRLKGLNRRSAVEAQQEVIETTILADKPAVRGLSRLFRRR